MGAFCFALPSDDGWAALRCGYRLRRVAFVARLGGDAVFVGVQPPGDGGGGEVGGVDTGEDTDQHGHGEVVDDLAAEDDKGDTGDDARAAGEQRTGQREVEASVDDLVEGALFVGGDAFANAVEHDDFIVDRVTGDREEGADEGEVQLAIE